MCHSLHRRHLRQFGGGAIGGVFVVGVLVLCPVPLLVHSRLFGLILLSKRRRGRIRKEKEEGRRKKEKEEGEGKVNSSVMPQCE
jgi:hypothetical protein